MFPFYYVLARKKKRGRERKRRRRGIGRKEEEAWLVVGSNTMVGHGAMAIAIISIRRVGTPMLD